jgi:hypothetical protein
MARTARESRLRRMAERQGLTLRKARRRDPNALDYGAFWLIDPDSGAVVHGGQYGISADDVEAALASGQLGRQQRQKKERRQ